MVILLSAPENTIAGGTEEEGEYKENEVSIDMSSNSYNV